jgi:hypothetical protein
MKGSYAFPVILIATGFILLLNQFDLFDFTWAYIIIIGSAVVGVFLLNKAFKSEKRQGLLGGSFFIMLAAILLLVDMGIIPIYDSLISGYIIISLGLANFIYYIFTRKSFNNITAGVIFSAIGLPFVIMFYTTADAYDIADVFSSYWPLLLITAGFGFLLDGMFKKVK